MAYNFGDQPARGKLTLEGATGETVEIEIQPGQRAELTINAAGSGIITARLDLSRSGQAIVSPRVTTTASSTQPGK
jgi:hypothetical protein